ncbi:hypothetical protein HN011_009642 [Eciton burchellii]|nr:hypothetical protein HN011_009642 [Eciton burchellii]
MPVDIPSFIYSAAVAGGGIYGYVKSKSIVSLGAGLLFGSVMGYGAYQMYQDPKNITLFLGTNAVLGGIMWMRFQNTGKLMPPGVIAICSTLMVVRALITKFTTPEPLKAE